VAVEDEEEFVAVEGAVAVGEAQAAVELRVVTKALVDSGRADEDQGKVFAVVSVAEQLKRGGCETFGFVDGVRRRRSRP
jgi:glucose-6-phosphate isomerase